MLNEIFQVAEALKNLGVASKEAHPSMKPMGKSPLLVVRLNNCGRIASIDILPAEHGDALKRIEHGSAGTSFPGFNLPSPVLDLSDVSSEKLKQFTEIQKDRKVDGKQRLDALRDLASLAKQRSFTEEQERQFNRIFHEFVPLIASDFTEPLDGVEAFVELLGILRNHPPTLQDFVSDLIAQVTRNAALNDALLIKILENFLVGKLAFKGVATVGSSVWWQQKRKEDKKGKTALFIDLDSPPSSATVVAHSRTCEMIESHLLKVRPGRGYAKSGKGAETRNGIDAFTGETGELTTSFPEPRVQVLRPPDLKLFSASSETPCLERYGLIESAIFPVSKLQSARMQNAILKLAAKKEQRGKTWFPIPSSLNEKKKPKSDLLVAYLEGEPEGRAPLAEMFGGEANSFSDADFEAIAQPVLEMLEGKVAANPNLNVRLLAFCPIDKAKKQISLNRSLRVQDVIRAAREWEVGARNVPQVSVWFYDRNTKQSVFRSHTAPCPLELSAVINRVWSTDAKNGFATSYQRAVSVADAYDIFLADTPLAKQKAQAALGLLISRMSTVLP